ncbi:MAG: mechanosensitive ion channel [Gammaproteobacteria bacterium]|nr:mechanosensitive ion channel [Gammaproteobacteria bacterium]
MQETIMHYATTYGLNILAAVVILLIGLWAARLVRHMTHKVMDKRSIDPLIISFVSTVLHVLLVAFVLIAAISKLGVQTTSLIAVLGAAGLAVALALQSSLSNIASGVIIITLRPFKVGDYVEAGANAGIIESIQLFYTKMRSPDNKELMIPNSSITSSVIVNYNARSERRCDMVFGVTYDADLDKTRRILQELLNQDERVLADPAPVIVVGELAESSINLWVRPWVKTGDFWDFKWDFTETVKKRFDAEGIAIPFPQRDVHMYQHPAPAGNAAA